MARRRRTTFTAKKSKSKTVSQTTGGDPGAPSAAEWGKMTVFGSFVVTCAVQDDGGIESKFCKGDIATVLPTDRKPGSVLELNEYWIAKIRDIRAIEVHGQESEEVWTKVQWYYSPANVADVMKSFDPSACGNHEFIFSDHFDFISPQSFNELITMAKLKDENPEQEYIGEDDLYCRYHFEVSARKIHPKPGSQTCICDNPYGPDNESTVMHFCPRASCRRWFHQTCLTKAKSKESTVTGRDLRLLCSSPDADEAVVLAELMQRPKKRRGRPAKRDSLTEESSASVQEKLDSLPDELIHIAQQPIVRGAAFLSGGVAGNVAAVVRARRLVYDAFSGLTVPDDWESIITGGSEKRNASDAIVMLKGRRFLPALMCPQCKGAI